MRSEQHAALRVLEKVMKVPSDKTTFVITYDLRLTSIPGVILKHARTLMIRNFCFGRGYMKMGCGILNSELLQNDGRSATDASTAVDQRT